MAKLVERLAVAAVDGAAVVGAVKAQDVGEQGVASLCVKLNGTTTTYSVRAVVEGSFDGVTWHKLVRFKDVTNAVTGNRYVRLPGVAAASTADIAADTLGSAEGTGTQVDTPWPPMLRVSTRMDTLTGGGNLDIRVFVA